MSEGKMLPPGAGRLIAGGALHATLKVSGGARGDGAVCSTFEIIVPARMLFQAAPAGHEDYFEELAALLRASNGRPDQEAVTELRSRYDIRQLTRFAPSVGTKEAK
jgi:hypothetical protein